MREIMLFDGHQPVHEQLKTMAIELFSSVNHALKTFRIACDQVNSLCKQPQACELSESGVFDSALRALLSELCASLSVKYCGESLSTLNYEDYLSFFPESASWGDVSEMDWQTLADKLINDAQSLEQEGLAQTAQKIARLLNLSSKYDSPIHKAGSVVCTVNRYGEYQAHRLQFSEYKGWFSEVETVTGESMNLPVFNEVSEALNECTLMSPDIESRTKFGKKGQALHFIWFKSKTEFHFSEDAFNSLIAFISSYAAESINEFKMPIAA